MVRGVCQARARRKREIRLGSVRSRERDDRSAETTGRRRAEGAGGDALRGGPADRRRAARAARPRDRGARTRDGHRRRGGPRHAGVVAVLTAADLPVSPNAPGRAGEPLAREEVVFAGQPVALVVAETEAAAEDAVDAVIVDLEPLEAVLDLEAAMAPGASRARAVEQDRGGHDLGGAHASVDAGDDDQPEEDLSDNVNGRQRLANGDAAGALAAADVTVSGRLRTLWVYQAYLEPQSAAAWLDFDGTLVVQSATQGAFAPRQGLAELLDLPLDRVRVRPTPLGGAFGGKLMLPE